MSFFNTQKVCKGSSYVRRPEGPLRVNPTLDIIVINDRYRNNIRNACIEKRYVLNIFNIKMISLTNIFSPFRYVDEEVGGIWAVVRGAGSCED